MEDCISESDSDPQPRTLTINKRCIQYPRNLYGLTVVGNSNTVLVGVNASFLSIMGNDNAVRVANCPGVVAVNGEGNALVIDSGGEEVYVSGEGNAVEVGGQEVDEGAFVLNWVNQQGMAVANKINETRSRLETEAAIKKEASQMKSDVRTDKPECAICQEELVSNPPSLKPVVSLECGHPFHRACLLAWEQIGSFSHQKDKTQPHSLSQCPLCRTKTVGVSRLSK